MAAADLAAAILADSPKAYYKCQETAVLQLQIVTNANQTILYNGSSGSNGWGLMAQTSGKLQPLLGGIGFLTATNIGLTIGTTAWYHVVFVKRAAGTAPEVWINGTKDTAPQGTTAPRVPSGTTNIGTGTSVAAGYAHYAIYETALSSTRIAAHWAALQVPVSSAIKTVMGVPIANVKTMLSVPRANVKTLEGLA